MAREETAGQRVQVKAERELTEAAGTRDHQGVVARVEPYRYADAYELAQRPSPLLVCLDRVTDPRNLGAVARSAEGAGATGIVVPAHGSAMVTPAVCRSSAGAVEHVPIAVVQNLARYLGEVKGPDLWVYGAAGDAGKPMWETDLTGGAAFVFGAEGEGSGRSCGARATSSSRSRSPARVESLNVSVAAAVLLYEARRQRMADPTFYLFDGFNLLHAGGFEDSRELTDKLASFVAEKGARGVLVFDGTGEDLTVRPARGALRRARRHAARASRGRAPRQGAGLPRLVRLGGARNIRPGGDEALLGDLHAGLQLEAHQEQKPMRVEDKLDPETRAKLEAAETGAKVHKERDLCRILVIS